MSGHQTPDRFPGERREDGLILVDEGRGEPIEIGGIRNVGGKLRVRDKDGIFDPRTGGFNVDDIVFDSLGRIVYDSSGLVVIKG